MRERKLKCTVGANIYREGGNSLGCCATVYHEMHHATEYCLVVAASGPSQQRVKHQEQESQQNVQEQSERGVVPKWQDHQHVGVVSVLNYRPHRQQRRQLHPSRVGPSEPPAQLAQGAESTAGSQHGAGGGQLQSQQPPAPGTRRARSQEPAAECLAQNLS